MLYDVRGKKVEQGEGYLLVARKVLEVEEE